MAGTDKPDHNDYQSIDIPRLIEEFEAGHLPTSQLLQALPLISYVVHIDAVGKMLYVSPQLESILGYNPEEWTSYSSAWYSRVHPNDLERVRETIAEHNARGIPLAGLEYRILDIHEESRWFKDVQNLVRGLDGELYAIGLLLEISDTKRAEQQIHTQKEEMRALLENSPEIITRYGPGFRHQYINPAVKQYTGYPPEYFLGKTDRELRTLGDRAEEWERTLAEVFETGEKQLIEFTLEGPAGITWHEGRLVPEHDNEGQIQSVLAIFHDITQLRQAEEAIRESEKRFRTLVETAPEAIVVLDAESGKFIDANRHASELYQLSREELLEFGPVELSPRSQPDGTDSAQMAQKKIERALDGESLVFEWNHLLPDGSEIPCEVRLVRLPARDRELLRATIADISPRKRAEAREKEQATRYQQLFERLPVGLYRTTPDGRILDVNEAMVRLLGYPDKETLMRESAIEVQVHSEGREDWTRLLEQEEVLHSHESELIRYDGSKIIVRENARIIRDEKGNVKYYEGSMEDVTETRHALTLLEQSEARYRDLFEGVPVGVYQSSPEGEFLDANETLVEMLGYSSKEVMLAANATDLYLDASSREQWKTELEYRGELRDYEVRLRRADGSVIWVREHARAARDDAGKLLFYEGTLEDITEQKQASEQIRRLAAFPSENPDPILASNRDGAITYANPAATLILRRLDLEAVSDLLPPDHLDLVQESMRREAKLTSTEVHRGDRVLRWTYYPQPHDGTIHLYAQDITDQKRAEEKLRYEAFHDPLTGLANRSLFMNRLDHALQRCMRHPEQQFALVFMDLNRFKIVNDSLGHMHGDMLLMAVAERLKACVRMVDSVARLGGDEFGILLEGVKEANDAIRVAERIKARLSQPFTLGDQTVYSNASIGIAFSNPGYTSSEELLRDADIAMYRAKNSHQSHEIFDTSMHQEALELMELETELRTAIERGEFSLVYQPVFSLVPLEIAGFEALIRWDHPRRGLLPPSEFLPLAEETGLILPIGDWVLQEACLQAREWQDSAPRALRPSMSVNMSASQFQDPELPHKVHRVLESTGLPAASLILEITESTLIRDIQSMGKTLGNLKALGVQIHIDDFGTGYSSLSILHEFPVDALKIDRGFVERLSDRDESDEVVRAMIELAHNLAIKVVAEGVETETQLLALTDLSSHYAQGFLLSPPLPTEAVPPLMEMGSAAFTSSS